LYVNRDMPACFDIRIFWSSVNFNLVLMEVSNTNLLVRQAFQIIT
jgi:hypothetical protein